MEIRSQYKFRKRDNRLTLGTLAATTHDEPVNKIYYDDLGGSMFPDNHDKDNLQITSAQQVINDCACFTEYGFNVDSNLMNEDGEVHHIDTITYTAACVDTCCSDPCGASNWESGKSYDEKYHKKLDNEAEQYYDNSCQTCRCNDTLPDIGCCVRQNGYLETNPTTSSSDPTSTWHSEVWQSDSYRGSSDWVDENSNYLDENSHCIQSTVGVLVFWITAPIVLTLMVGACLFCCMKKRKTDKRLGDFMKDIAERDRSNKLKSSLKELWKSSTNESMSNEYNLGGSPKQLPYISNPQHPTGTTLIQNFHPSDKQNQYNNVGPEHYNNSQSQQNQYYNVGPPEYSNNSQSQPNTPIEKYTVNLY